MNKYLNILHKKLNLLEGEGVYDSFSKSISSRQWAKIGIRRRAGVATPLFSIYSKDSIGIGEIPDLKLLIDWCKLTCISIIQLLPMNDSGYKFTPYDAESSFALEPMYLSINELQSVVLEQFQDTIVSLKKKFPCGQNNVNYAVKKDKLDLLWTIFKTAELKDEIRYLNFVNENKYWLKDYALYKVLKEKYNQKDWSEWDSSLRDRDPEELEKLQKKNASRIEFYTWLQWQISEQFKSIKDYATKNDVLLMGDLPILVSKDSADVWAKRNYFKLDLSSGAPPDMYSIQGQRWGMPPYRWEEIKRDKFEYVIQKLKYAENYYQLFRIDHSVGLFRIWTIQINEPLENHGQKGEFAPKNEELWEEHGRKILTTIIQNTEMLPCAEDLGTIPSCSYKVLSEFAIPGTDIQRWAKDEKKSFKFPEYYRTNSISAISTHDMTPALVWWLYEAGTIDEMVFKNHCETAGINFESVKEKLFHIQKELKEKLKWKEEISNKNVLLKILNLSEDKASSLIEMYEQSFTEKQLFWEYLGMESKVMENEITLNFTEKLLEKISTSASIFCIQLLQDWLSLSNLPVFTSTDIQINKPGTVNDKNWTVVMPYSLEEMLSLDFNQTIKDINIRTGRTIF